jgi:hypothetical protein
MRQQNTLGPPPERRATAEAYVSDFFQRVAFRPKSRLRKFFRYRYQAFFIRSGDAVNRLLLVFIKVFIKLRKKSWGQVESIFIHIPKTAGSSVRAQMETDFGRTVVTISKASSLARSLRLPCSEVRGIVLEHVNPMLLVNLGLLSQGDVNRASFSIIRNPEERFHSAWDYGVRGRYFPPGKSQVDVLNMVKSVLPEKFSSAEAEGYLFLRPQTDFLVGVEFQSGRLVRMDRLLKDSKLYTRQSGPIGHENVGIASQRPEDPSHRLRALIFETYWKDFELWENLR